MNSILVVCPGCNFVVVTHASAVLLDRFRASNAPLECPRCHIALDRRSAFAGTVEVKPDVSEQVLPNGDDKGL